MTSSGVDLWAKLTSAESKAGDRWKKQQESKLSTFKSNLPQVVAKDKQFCPSLHAEVNKQIALEISSTFNGRFEDWNLKDKLNKLDILKQELNQDNKSEAWRPSGCPSDDLAVTDVKLIEEAHNKLEREILNPLEEELKKLHQELNQLEECVQKADQNAENVIKNALENHSQ